MMNMHECEHERLRHIKEVRSRGRQFLDKVFSYYTGNPGMLQKNFLEFLTPEALSLEYSGQRYVLKVLINRKASLHQIEVYIPSEGTQFSKDPEFIKLNGPLIFFDLKGKLYIGKEQRHPPHPDAEPWEIIAEMHGEQFDYYKM